MSIYCETAAVTILALVGAALGLWFSRLPWYYWTLGYFIPLAIIGMIGAARWSNFFEFLPPFSWLVAGRKTFALIGFAVVKFGLLVDHYVAILEVQGDNVIVGDPLTGKEAIPFDQFRSKWRFTGVVLRRTL